MFCKVYEVVQGAANHSSASFLILNLLTLSQMQQGLVTNLCNKVWLPKEVALLVGSTS